MAATSDNAPHLTVRQPEHGTFDRPRRAVTCQLSKAQGDWKDTQVSLLPQRQVELLIAADLPPLPPINAQVESLTDEAQHYIFRD